VEIVQSMPRMVADMPAQPQPIAAWTGRNNSMKTLVVYDSVYGNTQAIAEAIASALPGDVRLQAASAANASDLQPGDLLIVGAPTQGGRPTEAAQRFLERLAAGSLAGVRAAGFDTRLTARWVRIFGYAAPKIADALKQKGGMPAASPGGFFVKGKEGPLVEGEVERAAAWARELAGKAVA
jgi:flavodoxin I